MLVTRDLTEKDFKDLLSLLSVDSTNSDDDIIGTLITKQYYGGTGGCHNVIVLSTDSDISMF